VGAILCGVNQRGSPSRTPSRPPVRVFIQPAVGRAEAGSITNTHHQETKTPGASGPPTATAATAERWDPSPNSPLIDGADWRRFDALAAADPVVSAGIDTRREASSDVQRQSYGPGDDQRIDEQLPLVQVARHLASVDRDHLVEIVVGQTVVRNRGHV